MIGLNCIAFIFLVVTILLNHVFLPEIIGILDISVKAMSSRIVLCVIHHVFFVGCDTVEIFSRLIFQLIHLSPVVFV